MAEPTHLSPFERFLTLFTRVRPGEGRCVFLFVLYAFLLLVSYYVFKTMRDVLILTEFSAEVKAYATATMAVVLLFVIPLYGALYRLSDPVRLIRWITLFFAMNVLVFFLLSRSGATIAFFYYVWTGIFGVMMVAQFWALAADTFNVKSGQRLFPVIMVGALSGSLVGGGLVVVLIQYLSSYQLLLVAGLILVATVGLTGTCRDSVPAESRAIEVRQEGRTGLENALGGFALVARDRYLVMLAAFVVLLNWINTTGEYILSETVTQHADILLGAGDVDSKAEFIGSFYGMFNVAVPLLGFLIQAFLVTRIYKYAGFSIALVIPPVLSAIGYLTIAFIPIFSIIRFVKVIENSADYSLQKTNLQALWLPTKTEEKYQAKTAIDTFFWRFGDLIQAGFIYAGLHWWSFGVQQFAMLNLTLALIWIGLATMMGREYKRLRRENLSNVSPRLNRPIDDLVLLPGAAIDLSLPHDTFLDADPGDHLEIEARMRGGAKLPKWLSFDANRMHFSGRIPAMYQEHVEIELVASDLDGLSVTETFRIGIRLRG